LGKIRNGEERGERQGVAATERNAGHHSSVQEERGDSGNDMGMAARIRR
jgi:hypothetical protein